VRWRAVCVVVRVFVGDRGTRGGCRERGRGDEGCGRSSCANYVKPTLEMLYTYLHIILYISVKGGVFLSRHCLGGMKETEKRRKKSGTFCVKTTDE